MTIRLLFLSLLLASQSLFAQAPGVSIFNQSMKGLREEDADYNKQLAQLIADEKVLSREDAEALYKKPKPRSVELAEPATIPLTPQEIAKLADQQNFYIGWAEKCHQCPDWHFQFLGGGYAISADGVLATCAHVIEPIPEGEVKDAVLVAIDGKGRVHAVTDVIACHVEMDAALVKIEAETIPRALNDQIRPGDPAYCHSRPQGQGDYFTAGIVNRFYWNKSPKGKDHMSLQNVAKLHLNVSCRWAPGSSGSPVFDHFGNVIGHVALISTIGDDESEMEGEEDNSLIILHAATPARAVIALANKANDLKSAQ